MNLIKILKFRFKNLKQELNQQLNNDGYINFDANLEKISN